MIRRSADMCPFTASCAQARCYGRPEPKVLALCIPWCKFMRFAVWKHPRASRHRLCSMESCVILAAWLGWGSSSSSVSPVNHSHLDPISNQTITMRKRSERIARRSSIYQVVPQRTYLAARPNRSLSKLQPQNYLPPAEAFIRERGLLFCNPGGCRN